MGIAAQLSTISEMSKLNAVYMTALEQLNSTIANASSKLEDGLVHTLQQEFTALSQKVVGLAHEAGNEKLAAAQSELLKTGLAKALSNAKAFDKTLGAQTDSKAASIVKKLPH